MVGNAIVIASVVAGLAAAQNASPWKVIWADEFNGAANTPPDPAKWTYDLGGGGWGNRELEVYTKDPANVFQDGNGHLVIRALKTGAGEYTSARIKTLGKFSVVYGKIEARIRIPYGQGVWPAFWMVGEDRTTAGWPKCGEIDVMENIGREPSAVHGTIHGPGYSGRKGIGRQYDLSSGHRFADDFHVFGIEWSPGSIDFFVDGKSYSQITSHDIPPGTEWVYNHPFFLLLNLAVGGSWPGNPDETTVFPQEMVVDWVRVAQREREKPRR